MVRGVNNFELKASRTYVSTGKEHESGNREI